MRILHFYKTFFPDSMGGIEQVINQIARGSSKFGVKAEVLSLSSKPQPKMIEMAGYLAHRAKLTAQIASTGFSISAFSSFRKLADKADVIHYHFPWPFMDLVHLTTSVRKPAIVTYHSDVIRQKYLLKIYRPLKRNFLSSMDRIVATSPNYLATSGVLKEYSDKVSVIPIGLDKETYPESSEERKEYWRQKFGEDFFLFVGVLRYYKGLHILIEAAKGLDLRIVIVGSGPVERELKNQASSLGARNIYFLGHLENEDKVALLTLCYGVVFPSHLRSEAFGVSLLEGAMYGKPMISSEIGTGTTFVNIAGETGLVVPPSNPFALRQAMQYLWDNPNVAAEMGRRAEERYRRFFTGDKMVESYVGLYNDLVKSEKWLART
ncbi:glycosyltransferase WbpZ [Cupriavidus basilensis OR16]|uniref:Glycosyltransferase WbpZ n=1 Tax=Cupriavidus basilensis OR16 TaxID=1127483 RepID=H1SG16_9BURK|nr:glycosyltransferase family 4 protein [Cupriavidus basilensis]EHP38502.1 glycosyltransferase WbpZ [Cupriavidus basilensis OR16]